MRQRETRSGRSCGSSGLWFLVHFYSDIKGKHMKGHIGVSGLQEHSVGTVYPFGVVSSGDLYYSVDYRKPLNSEMRRLPYAVFSGAFRASIMRRVAEYCGSDKSSVTFSISLKRPAGEEIRILDEPTTMAWEHIGRYEPIEPQLLGFSLAHVVEDYRQYQLSSSGDGSYTLWGELMM